MNEQHVNSAVLPPADCGEKRRVAVAMSGGVDSSVTAALLKRSGYEVGGVFMILAQPDVEKHIDRARKVATLLEIPFYVADFAEIFQRDVLDYFKAAYLAGKTPNPCMICNRRIKFGALWQFAAQRGYDGIATGHYARVRIGSEGTARLYRGVDQRKDQSYFLASLGQEQLRRVCFPLGDLSKVEVYEFAAALDLRGVHGEESQDVCFLKGTCVSRFIEKHCRIPPQGGEIITVDGRVLGRHGGVHHFTVGQRRGLGVPDSTPYHVVGLDAGMCRVIVGKKEDLYHHGLLVGEMNWIGPRPSLPCELDVKIRHRHAAASASMSDAGGDKIEVRFHAPQRAITPGQFAVFYREDEVIGAGEILNPLTQGFPSGSYFSGLSIV